MELKQMEFFLTSAEEGSFSKGAKKLYTTQPNVSKVICKLEKELGSKLFERKSKGLVLTDYGIKVKNHFENIKKELEILDGIKSTNREILKISAYTSNMVANILTDMLIKDNISINHQEGNVEEITNHVEKGISEIGLIYIAKKHLSAFNHVISHKDLDFVELDTKELCINVGPNHYFYNRESINYDELKNLNFVSGLEDFFSMEHHLEQISLGAIEIETLQNVVYTNSNHLSISLLLNSDLCSFGINVLTPKYKMYDIKALKITGIEPILIVGYVQRKENTLSKVSEKFINNFKNVLNESI